MLQRKEILEVLESYDVEKVKIGVIGSHSALDVCDGAVEEDFRTFVVCQKGREKTYTQYFKSERENGKLIRGMVDEVLLLDKFKEIMSKENQEKLAENNVLFVPNRSFTSYVDMGEIENNFKVPLVGSRNLLRSEEREEEKSYYWLLEKAKLPYPEKIDNPKDIN
ncbi:MAG: DUF1246 domain-containing protein, partial [Candidatus Thermoplasmatota archaeon]|nr:DUF1246 domain-containing protein [Candidatus Thermoplasmatota archaeon]